MPTTVDGFRSIRGAWHEAVIACDLDKQMSAYIERANQDSTEGAGVVLFTVGRMDAFTHRLFPSAALN